jgi:RimJ/RimL family protein N-acetyltransferase
MTDARIFTEPVTLSGRHVLLEPLSHDHHDALVEAVRDGELWKLWYTIVAAPGDMRADIENRLAQHKKGTMVPFTVRSLPDRKIVGMTTYLNIEPTRHRVEIGSTWYANAVQRTPLNTEAKLLLLGHAFEAMKCIAVEFRTSFFNHSSRRAIERLGAKQDGILRNYGWHKNGTIRDTVVFSITNDEWPAVKSNLEFKLGKPSQRD